MAGNADTPPEGDFPGGLDALTAGLYEDLHRIARRERGRAGSPRTLQTTAVLNEAYLKLHRKDEWESRAHFLGVAATAMRHVLVDAARTRFTSKRGSGVGTLPIEAAEIQPPANTEDRDLVRLGEALRELETIDPELARLVDCRFFAGLDEVETGQVLGVSDRTVRRRWTQARAWLHREVAAGD